MRLHMRPECFHAAATFYSDCCDYAFDVTMVEFSVVELAEHECAVETCRDMCL